MPYERRDKALVGEGFRALVENDELVVVRPDVPGRRAVMAIPIGDLLWLLREAHVDWRAGLEPPRSEDEAEAFNQRR